MPKHQKGLGFAAPLAGFGLSLLQHLTPQLGLQSRTLHHALILGGSCKEVSLNDDMEIWILFINANPFIGT